MEEEEPEYGDARLITQVLEFRVKGQGSRVKGQGSRVKGQGSRVKGQGLKIKGGGSRVEGGGLEFRGFRMWGLGFGGKYLLPSTRQDPRPEIV